MNHLCSGSLVRMRTNGRSHGEIGTVRRMFNGGWYQIAGLKYWGSYGYDALSMEFEVIPSSVGKPACNWRHWNGHSSITAQEFKRAVMDLPLTRLPDQVS